MRASTHVVALVCVTLLNDVLADTTLVTWDGGTTAKKWQDMNDPVMGGQSHSAFNTTGGIGYFSGLCAIVPFLKAPGFCKISTQLGLLEKPTYPDVSEFINGALLIEARSTTAGYKGFKVAFDAKNATRPGKGTHHGAPSFKADFAVGSDWSTVRVPFSKFSVDWSDYTGECSTKDPDGTQHHCCSKEHPEVCPTVQHLAALTGLEVWAEGVEGSFDIQLRSISAGP